MKSLRLFTGNRLDLLAQALAKVLETPLASILEQEIIVVQSKGMERWISMQLASHFGVWANGRFPFPNAFVYDIFQRVLPDLPDCSVFDPKFSTWKIMGLLPSHLDEPGFESLNHYLDGTRWSLKQLQLSRRIAETFDQYLLYRPEMIAGWEAGEEDHWQAVVWRDLAGDLSSNTGQLSGNSCLKRCEKQLRTLFVCRRGYPFLAFPTSPPFTCRSLKDCRG